MKGIVLAGGLATRLYPLTFATNKHLLPIYNKPMIFYPIETLLRAGIDEILVVTSNPHAGHFLGVLKNGKELGVRHLEYAFQENPKGGIADALALAEDFADGQSIAVILGDNPTDADISADVKEFEEGAKIFLKEVPDPKRFGVPEFSDTSVDGQLVDRYISRIYEKPENPPSNYAVTGLYLYDHTVFDKIKQITPSDRGELEITDINNMYLHEGRLDWAELKGFWSDAGTFDTLLKANLYWYQKGLQNGSN